MAEDKTNAVPPVPEGEKSSVSLMQYAADKKIKPRIDLFYDLIQDAYEDRLRINEMTGQPEYWNHHSESWVQWTDVGDGRMQAFFQTNYGLYAPKMLEAALRIYLSDHKVNPLHDVLETIRWDGKARIDRFLIDIVKCRDSQYNRECSRLIFAGGIHRAYRPGCKFDDMIVLIGRQGGGKSTLVRWLNVEDQYFREIKTINGKEGVEALRGVWIGEVAELMAITRVKESEAVKAFITAQEDSYRAPYNKHVEVIPRRCLFIGTTNNPQFLADKTGNRRFYPVLCKEDGYDLLGHEQEIREYIRQCWAEALTLFRRGELQPYAKRELLNVIQEAQESATEDDWRIGAIRDYLDNAKQKPSDTVCIIELWHKALGEPEESKPARSDSIEIGKIMNSFSDWERCDKAARTPWGVQKVYRKRQSFFPFWQ